MKNALTLLFALSLFNCHTDTTSTQGSNASTGKADTTSEANLPNTSYAIFATEEHETFNNYTVLIDSVNSDSDLLIIAKVFELKECQNKACNTVSFWDSKAAYQLYLSRTDNKAWRKRNWAKVCESNLADYIVSVKEIVLYPLMDSQYYQYGGKRKRPSPSSFEL